MANNQREPYPPLLTAFAIILIAHPQSRLGVLSNRSIKILLLLLMQIQYRSRILSRQKLSTLTMNGKLGLLSLIQLIGGTLKMSKSQMKLCSSNVMTQTSWARDEYHILPFMTQNTKTKILGRALRLEPCCFIDFFVLPHLFFELARH
jgi:hypothetical protein